MNSTVTSKFQTTVPKTIREELGISINDSLEWVLEEGHAIVRPIHSQFLTYQGKVKTGPGNISSDIEAAREKKLEKYR